MAIPLSTQIAEVQREIAMRRNVYPKQVAIKKMSPSVASHHLSAMEAVLKTLQQLQSQHEDNQ